MHAPPAVAAVHSESERRVRRIRALAVQLEEQTVLNTARSRARCRELAGDILGLLTDEDRAQPPEPARETDPAVLRRVTQAIGARQAADAPPNGSPPAPEARPRPAHLETGNQ